MLTRDQVITLREAVRIYNLDRRTAHALRRRIDGRGLMHLGWQERRGWFYRVADVERVLDEGGWLSGSSGSTSGAAGRTHSELV